MRISNAMISMAILEIERANFVLAEIRGALFENVCACAGIEPSFSTRRDAIEEALLDKSQSHWNREKIA